MWSAIFLNYAKELRSDCANHFGQELTNDRFCSFPCRQYFSMVEWFSTNSGGEIRNQREAKNLHTCLTGSNRLQCGRHSHNVSTNSFCHINFCWSLIMWSTELHI